VQLSKFVRSKKATIYLLLGAALIFSGLFAIYSYSLVNTNIINAPFMVPTSSSINTAQLNLTDPQHDFLWISEQPVPLDQEPDPMYDLKKFSYDSTANITLEVYGTLDGSDGNMSSTGILGEPIAIMFADPTYLYYLLIGSSLDTGNDRVRAHLMRIDMEAMESAEWDGNIWTTMAIATSDDTWDLCVSDPQGTSVIEMDLSGVLDFNINNTDQYYAMSMISIGMDFAYDEIRSPPQIDPAVILWAMMAQEAVPSVIPSYPPLMILSAVFITTIVAIIIFRKRKIFNLL
jgi:hypothetical protein